MKDEPLLFDPKRSLADRVAATFAPNGPLARKTQGFSARAGQVEFALAAAEALEKKSTLIAEAGTGTGKTFAYLTPALLSGATVIISTAGKPLQDQLFKKDIPILSRALGLNVRAAVLKGRSNYVCLHRLKRVREEGLLPERDSYEKLRKIERFAEITKTGDKAELTDVPETDRLWPYVTSTRENCLGSERCPHYEECFVKLAREKALESQIVVVNHHLYLSSMAMKRQSENKIDGMLPAAQLTVFDEAHQLPQIATDFFGTKFSTYQLQDIASEARQYGEAYLRDGAKWSNLYDDVVKHVYDLRLAVMEIGLVEGDRKSVQTIERFHELRAPFNEAVKAFERLGNAFEANKGRNDEVDTLYEYWKTVYAECERWQKFLKKAEKAEKAQQNAKAESENPASLSETEPATDAPADGPSKGMIRWVEVLQNGVRFNETPLSFSNEFREMRETEGGAWVFTSATLSAGGNFKHYLMEVGLPPETPAHSWESPFVYWEQGCFYLPNLPAPANNTLEHAGRVVEAAWPLINAAGGRTFVLCTSLAAVNRAADLLEAKLKANRSPWPLLVQGEMPRATLIEEFRRRGNAILVGSMSFWEGVDVRGDALSLVVIDKIPFAPPDDPITTARCDAIRASGGNPFFEYSLPEAIIALKQGAGRLIRSETDRGVLMLCDSRVAEKPYGKRILKSLPDFYRTRRAEKAIEFFLNPTAYYEGLYH